eukprot:scaffold49680_cov63-Cyclotella_meneghiniana.AAC.4
MDGVIRTDASGDWGGGSKKAFILVMATVAFLCVHNSRKAPVRKRALDPNGDSSELIGDHFGYDTFECLNVLRVEFLTYGIVEGCVFAMYVKGNGVGRIGGCGGESLG